MKWELLPINNQNIIINKLTDLNDIIYEYGLQLTPCDCAVIAFEQTNSIKNQARFEFGGGISVKLLNVLKEVFGFHKII